MLKQPIAGQTLLISLQSWRYIQTLSLLAYLFTALFFSYSLSMVIIAVISLLFGFMTAFYCWRLWMDEKFFRLLSQPQADLTAFDEAIKQLWGKEVSNRTLEQRWAATGRLIRQAWLWVSLQWLVVVVMLFVGYFAKQGSI